MVLNFKLPKISSAFLILTQRCNLLCSYCFVHKNPSTMSYEVALEAVKFLIKNAEEENVQPSINFFGGEPLLMWDSIIVPLTNYIRQEYKKPFSLSMTSNCILMTEEKLKFMKDNNIGLLFSIDGAEETQNINRPLVGGGESFKRLREVIPMIRAYFPNTTFRSTIANNTVAKTFDNLKFAFDSGYNNVFTIPNVFTEWSFTEKDELVKQIRLFGDYFIENARSGKLVHLNPFNEKINQINQINNAYRNNQYRTEGKGQLGYGKCGLGANRYASVSPTGELYSCQELVGNEQCGNKFTIGDIYKGTDDEKRYEIIRMFDKQKVTGKNHKCDECKLTGICDGGCVINNYLINGNMNEMPEMLCFWYQHLLAEAIRVTQILGSEQNKLFKDYYFKKGGG